MKGLYRGIALLLCVVLLTGMIAAQSPVEEQVTQAVAGLSALGGKAGRQLRNESDFPAGTSACDWSAMALALGGGEEFYSEYLDALRRHVEQEYAQNACLDTRKATEYHRITLTVLALGGDPTAFGTRPDGSAIDLVADGTYNYLGGDLGAQGLNGWIWALLALDASGVTVPESAAVQRQDMVQAILSAQEPDGGFGLIAGSSDVDITAMAVQALAAERSACEPQLEAALSYLAESMNEHCGYLCYGYENAESIAQVVLALCAMGIDPETDSRFTRSTETLLTRLHAFMCEDGSFAHLLGTQTGDRLASAQSTLALLAVQRLRTQSSGIYCFTDYEGPRQRTQQSDTVWLWVSAGVVVLALAGAAVFAGRRKKNG